MNVRIGKMNVRMKKISDTEGSIRVFLDNIVGQSSAISMMSMVGESVDIVQHHMACHSRLCQISSRTTKFFSNLFNGQVYAPFFSFILGPDSPWSLVLRDVEIYLDSSDIPIAFSITTSPDTPYLLLKNLCMISRLPLEAPEMATRWLELVDGGLELKVRSGELKVRSEDPKVALLAVTFVEPNNPNHHALPFGNNRRNISIEAFLSGRPNYGNITLRTGSYSRLGSSCTDIWLHPDSLHNNGCFDAVENKISSNFRRLYIIENGMQPYTISLKPEKELLALIHPVKKGSKP